MPESFTTQKRTWEPSEYITKSPTANLYEEIEEKNYCCKGSMSFCEHWSITQDICINIAACQWILCNDNINMQNINVPTKQPSFRPTMVVIDETLEPTRRSFTDGTSKSTTTTTTIVSTTTRYPTTSTTDKKVQEVNCCGRSSSYVFL